MCGFPASGSRRRLTQSQQRLPVTPSATSENNLGVVRLIANLPFYRRFVRPPSTEAPSLHRSFPASRYCEPLRHPSQPGFSHTNCKLTHTAVTAGTSRVGSGPLCLHAVANTPAERIEPCSLVPFHPLRPSPKSGQVGSCINGFGACSAFTHVTACTLAKSPSDPLHQRLLLSRCLHCCSDCYRVERTSSRAGLSPLWTTAFSRRTR